MPHIDRDDAIKIANKLDASISERSKHTIAKLSHDGRIVAQFGIQRGTKNRGHSYIPGQIFVSRKEASELADCTLSRADWIAILRTKGLLK